MSELGAELGQEWGAWISGLLLENTGHWLEGVAGLFDLAWYARRFLLELSSSVSVIYFCKIKREGTKHLGLKQLKELSSSSSKFWSIFYYLLSVVDVLDSLLHVKIIPPWRTQTALIRKASWCIYFIPPPSVKDYAMYLIKRMQPCKSCTLVSVHTHFWKTFAVVLSGSLPLPPPPAVNSSVHPTVLLQLCSLHHFCWRGGRKRCSHKG